MIELRKINPDLPDATFDLDGTVFKMNILETYIEWISKEHIINPIPTEIRKAKEVWKQHNTEENYNAHIRALVRFFIEQIPGKEVATLAEAAGIVARQQRHRRWGITVDIIKHLRDTHNIIAISLMPEWLMEPFTRDLDFVALIGSTYITRDGLFTDTARTIHKADEYAKLRDNNTDRLDIHMGDTIGDMSLITLAKRPILFNPSYTLLSDERCEDKTIISSNKDVVTVSNSSGIKDSLRLTSTWGPPLNIDAILREVKECN